MKKRSPSAAGCWAIVDLIGMGGHIQAEDGIRPDQSLILQAFHASHTSRYESIAPRAVLRLQRSPPVCYDGYLHIACVGSNSMNKIIARNWRQPEYCGRATKT